MARLLVTGASGFLGSALARRWSAAGHEVHALVRASSSLARLEPVRTAIELRVADTPEQAAAVATACAPDAIAHTACAYGRGGEPASAVLAVNVAFGLALLQSALDGGRELTFLNAGSALPPELGPYALSKRQFADWGRLLAAQAPERLRFVDLRQQHFYGAGDDPSKFTSHVLHACHDGQPALALTAGEQQRDFIHIDDATAAWDVVLAHAPAMGPAESIDVGSGQALPLREFVELVHRLTGSRTELRFGALPYRAGEPMRCVADTSRLRALGWRPAFDLVSGLRETLSKEFDS